MPYSIAENQDGCEGKYAVVKDATGEVMGCHDSYGDAEDQIAAINISESGRADFEGSAMIAFYLSPSDAQALAIDHENALPASELHITLAYLGRTDNNQTNLGVLKDLAQTMATGRFPFRARLNGVGRFLKKEEGGTRSAGVLLIDSPDVRKIRSELVQALGDLGVSYSDEHDFLPHITLAYLEDGEELPQVEQRGFVLDTLTLKYGAERFDYPFTKRSRKFNMSNPTDTPEEEMQVHFLRAMPSFIGRDGAGIDVDHLKRNPELPIPFVASTEGIKADGHDLRMGDWDIRQFNRYGPILWAHNHYELPLGRGEARIGDKLYIDVHYDTDDERAMKVRTKALKGMMAGSVGWASLRAKNSRKVTNVLREFSMVPVGLDPDALPVGRALPMLQDQTFLDDILAAIRMTETERQSYEQRIAALIAKLKDVRSFLQAQRDGLLDIPALSALLMGSGSEEPDSGAADESARVAALAEILTKLN